MITSTVDQHRASVCHGHSGTDRYAITVSTADTKGSGGERVEGTGIKIKWLA